MSPGATLHFNMPQELQSFSLFGKLPYDIRHQIWETAIYLPGIHFLKFEKSKVPSTDSGSEDVPESDADPNTSSVIPGEVPDKEIKARFSGLLSPIFPTRAADMSYYITASKTLTQLSLTCQEAADMVTKIIKKQGTLTLDNGRLITLGGSSDVICIDYPDMCYTHGLGKWADNLDLEQLTRIRRLAVRYNPEWDEGRHACQVCGRVHDATRKELPRRHLYEFVALFRNLEAFYFLDYLTVRKPKDHLLDQDTAADKSWLAPEGRKRMVSLVPGSLSKGERFASGGRTYYEVDPQLCLVNTHVFSTLDWVQESFIDHCTTNSTKHPSPENVKFRVLGCEWEVERPVPKKRQFTAKVHSKRAKTEVSAMLTGLGDLNLEDQRRCGDFERPPACPVSFGDGGDSSYSFNFRKPFSV